MSKTKTRTKREQHVRISRQNPPFSDAAHKAITSTLVRLCFPHRQECPELVLEIPEGALWG